MALAELKSRLERVEFIRTLYHKHFKKFDGKIRIYLTLECNAKCPYCVNEFFGKIAKFRLVKGDKWAKAINREGRDVIFTGGEPALHPDFIDIINSIDKKINVKVYTNFSWSEKLLKKFIKEVKRSVEFYGSYHPSTGKPEKFIHIINELIRHGKFKGTIHAVGSKKQKAFLRKIKPVFKMANLNLIIDADQYVMFEGCSKKFRKKVKCSKKLILISPDGCRYQCVSKMLRKKNPLENFISGSLGNDKVESICGDYGFCCPCDGLGETKIQFV